MATDLALKAHPTVSLSPSLAALASSITVVGTARMIPRAMTNVERAEAEEKEAALCSALAPASRREIGAAVLALLSAYPVANQNDAMQAALVEAWMEAMEGAPAWAIAAARKRWMRGKVEGANPEFAPKPPTFRRLVDDEIAAVANRRHELLSVLAAAPPEPAAAPASPEEKARVDAAAADFKRSLESVMERNLIGRAA